MGIAVLLLSLAASSWSAQSGRAPSSPRLVQAPVVPRVQTPSNPVLPAGLALPQAAPSQGVPVLPAPLSLDSAKAPESALPAAGAPASPGEAPTVREQLETAAQTVGAAQAADQGGAKTQGEVGKVYGEAPKTGEAGAVASEPGAAAAPAAAQGDVNDEGVFLLGRAKYYFKEVRHLVDKHKATIDLSESLDVMDDSYADVWAKLKAVEALAAKRGVEKENTHLEETLTWVDGLLKEKGKTTAIHTHRVFFHRAKNPRSEIEEGIRRVDGYIESALSQFKPKGKAERTLGGLDEVVLVFDSRGYDEIKAHLKAREAEIDKQHGSRYRFVYLDELVGKTPDLEAVRAQLNGLTAKYKGKGLDKIIEGVIYGRYVGLLLELKTIDHYLGLGYKILQSGRELFTPDNKYITELDTVVQAPDGKVYVVEAKSARVKLPHDEVLADKIVRKLEVYKAHRARLEEGVGAKVDGVVFSLDVGPNDDLIAFLEGKKAELSERYGFSVSFLFLVSDPGSSAERSLVDEPPPPPSRKPRRHGNGRRRR